MSQFWPGEAAWTDSRWAKHDMSLPLSRSLSLSLSLSALSVSLGPSRSVLSSYRLFSGEQQGVDVFEALKLRLVYSLDDVPARHTRGGISHCDMDTVSHSLIHFVLGSCVCVCVCVCVLHA